MTKAASRNHRHTDSGSSGEWRDQKRSFIADTASRMFVDFRFGDVRKIEHLSRMKHRVCQRGGFGVSHSIQKDRHQQRGTLIVSNVTIGDPTNEEFDLLAREFAA